MRIDRRIVGSTVLALLLACALLTEATAQVSVSFLRQAPSDQMADHVLARVVENIHMARGDDGAPLPPLSEAERATPLLERELVKEVIDIGVASGIGQVCGLDWQSNNFLPLMRRERSRGDRSQHQIAAIAMIHGLMQNQVATAGSCGANGAAGAAEFYALKWGQPRS